MGDNETESPIEVEPSDAISVNAESLTRDSVSTEDATSIAPIPKIGSHESIPAVHSYQIKPILADKFKPASVKEIIRTVLAETLTNKTYNPETVKKWTVDIANDISSKVKELKMKRYKHVVQVVIGEYKGAGVKSVVRCLWDAETDGYTSDIFTNDTIFCLVTVYAIYLY